jgi:hypothetical protein
MMMMMLALWQVDVSVGWDRFSVDVTGVSAITVTTTRFLDDVSPAGYVGARDVYAAPSH